MWVVNTENGVWEGEKLKHIAKDIANYYRDDSLPNITKIYFLNDNDKEKYLNDKVVLAFETEMQEWHEHYIECDIEEVAYQQEIRSDYYARCL